MVQFLPSGDISHFSASSGMYAPVCRSMPTRNSRAGRLSRLPLQGLSQVKLVSYPMGATAMVSRSSFPLAGAGDVTFGAYAFVATPTMVPSVPRRNSRRRDLRILLSSWCLLRTRYERDYWSDCTAWYTRSGHRCSLTAGIWRMQWWVRPLGCTLRRPVRPCGSKQEKNDGLQ